MTNCEIAATLREPSMENLYNPPPRGEGEFVETLAATGTTRIERIVSHGETSPEGFWYDQDDHEFVAVLQGSARLRFQTPDEEVTMGPGDHLTIAAHRRHRIEWTTPDGPTVWLAVFFAVENSVV
ncbi:cupin domain-containing protein [Paludisphaera rhizosphaerae]|uniref:cupin domain-containing protein n=2 Tax=Paludisphaera rhizosphaerae TaxID=2711216 RepID=UPI00197ED852|nr:cupin domain-containing protein [Paludisphaera rhizosphaerae]